MLESTMVGNTHADTVEFEWTTLSELERRLIKLYRHLTERERQQLRRFTEVMAENPTEGSGS